MKRITLLVLLAIVAFGVPAAAAMHAKHAQHHGAKARACVPRNVGYAAGGTLVSGSLSKNADGTYSGTLTVHVTRAGRHARADKGTDRSYTLDHAKVRLHGQDPAALKAGDRVRLRGKVTKLPKRCDQTGFTATVTIHRVGIRAPKAP